MGITNPSEEKIQIGMDESAQLLKLVAEDGDSLDEINGLFE